MARIKFTRHLERHLAAPPLEAAGATVREVLTQALLDAPMFQTRWRWVTNRALAVLR